MRRRGGQQGFTLIELMVALTILIIGLLGLMGIVMVSMRASSFSRRGTEAAVLAEDKIEDLRTAASLADGTVTETSIDARGNSVAGAPYTRTTTISTFNYPDIGDMKKIVVDVSWTEQEQGNPAGDFDRHIVLHTERMP